MPAIEDLEAQLRTAQAAAEAYSTEITEKYRREFPLPDGWTGLPDPALLRERAAAWTDEERAELDRLRTAARELAVELNRARQTGTNTSGD